jgi:hypothetical protein
MKTLKNFRFVFEKIDAGKLAIVVNETHIIFISSKRITSWPPHI